MMWEKMEILFRRYFIMKRKALMIGILSAVMVVAASVTSFAGSWKQRGNQWWYQEDDGSYPESSWEEIDEKWYYFDANGYMCTNMWVGNYYVGEDGAMLTDTVTPDGISVGEDGARVIGEGGLSMNSVAATYGYSEYGLDTILVLNNDNTYSFQRTYQDRSYTESGTVVYTGVTVKFTATASNSNGFNLPLRYGVFPEDKSGISLKTKGATGNIWLDRY